MLFHFSRFYIVSNSPGGSTNSLELLSPFANSFLGRKINIFRTDYSDSGYYSDAAAALH